jgi:hypothetical protein
VTTWWVKLEIFKCLPWQGKVGFGNIHTLLGVVVDGVIEKGRARITLKVWKDCSLDFYGEQLNLKKGDRIDRSIELK